MIFGRISTKPSLSFKEFKEKGTITEPKRYKKYKEKRFQTPTGKVELYSTLFEEYGYDPLPHYREPPESPLNTPHLWKQYPLILISGARSILYFHSEGRQISSLRTKKPNPQLEIHPETADKLDIEQEDWINIETPRVEGKKARFKAKITQKIHPKVVNADHGWWFPEKQKPEYGVFESNINLVTSGDSPSDEIIGSVPTRGTLCRIKKE
ncbi:hypothetical protein AKJ37_02265 [candidate division MSBL1 archaeon SCGC-AAA259I09]|uniref:Molybdopterin dinucleotide-binding domain-containing protein n=1 Tax=candidate division MSBL1 archaeon SCGC-AAA259I09 TaxID=1698267 RepID=A0A133UUA7_9EURY|nr:hypothetical protein AKJ37_02265 [candidate division MSBL1 archaeon SCGC-AAA259I09]